MAATEAVAPVALADIESAREVLAGVALETPMQPSRWLSDRIGGPAYLKCENLQRTGSFKIRGAYLRMSRLSAQERARGVVAGERARRRGRKGVHAFQYGAGMEPR